MKSYCISRETKNRNQYKFRKKQVCLLMPHYASLTSVESPSQRSRCVSPRFEVTNWFSSAVLMDTRSPPSAKQSCLAAVQLLRVSDLNLKQWEPCCIHPLAKSHCGLGFTEEPHTHRSSGKTWDCRRKSKPQCTLLLTVDVLADVFPLSIAVFIIPLSRLRSYHLTAVLIIIPVIRLAWHPESEI